MLLRVQLVNVLAILPISLCSDILLHLGCVYLIAYCCKLAAFCLAMPTSSKSKRVYRSHWMVGWLKLERIFNTKVKIVHYTFFMQLGLQFTQLCALGYNKLCLCCWGGGGCCSLSSVMVLVILHYIYNCFSNRFPNADVEVSTHSCSGLVVVACMQISVTG